jgi:hypothetical protein
MFLGHYGVALALKRAEPKVSLGTLFLAVQLADLLWGVFLLLGWEHVRIVPGITAAAPFDFYDYPISHSLLGSALWGLVAAAVYYSWPTRDTTRHWQASALVGAAVFSHFPLDVLVHIRDLPLAGDDSTKIGLGLWNHPGATLVLELLFLAAGVAVYVALRSHRHPVRRYRLVTLIVVLLGTYLGTQYGPLPSSVRTVAISDVLFLLAISALAAWADRRPTPAELERRPLSSR